MNAAFVARSLVVACVACALVAYATTTWLVQPLRIPSGSMQPTLARGDVVLAWKGPLARPLRRGTIVVFHPPDDADVLYVKRVIGLPGDHVGVRADAPVIDGEPVPTTRARPGTVRDDTCGSHPVTLLDETLDGQTWTVTRDTYTGPLSDLDPIVVPDGTVWVMGDDRAHAQDSRSFGPVPVTAIVGTVDEPLASFDACPP